MTTEADGPRIAVLVDREGLGDSLLKLPFLRALHRAFPRHRVWWIACFQTAMADRLRPFTASYVDQVIEQADLFKPAHAVIPRLRRLPAFAMVFDARTRVVSVLLARVFLRHQGFYACLPGFMLSDRRPPGRFRRPPHVARRMLTMIEAATRRPADAGGGLPVSDAARALAAALLPAGPDYVGLAPGSREAVKNWPLDRFIDLARALLARGRMPVFLIGPSERPWVDQLRAGAPGAHFAEYDRPDRFGGLDELDLTVAVAERLGAAVANDSGAGHLLAASGAPLVSLFGPSDPARWAPLAEPLRIVRAQRFGGTTMASIPVSAVVDAVEDLLGLPEAARR